MLIYLTPLVSYITFQVHILGIRCKPNKHIVCSFSYNYEEYDMVTIRNHILEELAYSLNFSK